jgi:PAS domain S-box-containing protein
MPSKISFLNLHMQSSPKNNALFMNASMGVVVVNSKGVIQLINPFAIQLFGYAAEEITGKPIETLIPRRYHQMHEGDRSKYVKHPRSRPMGVGMDLYAIKKDGTEFPVEVSLSAFDNDGEENVIAFVSDITIRKNDEEEIRKLNDELEATVEQRTKDLIHTLDQLKVSSDKLEAALYYQKALLDNAGAMIFATDEKGVIRLFNPEAALKTGYSENEIVNKKTPLLLHDKKEIARKRNEIFNESGIEVKDDFEVVVYRSKQNTHEEAVYSYIRKNGTSFPISLTITAIRNNAGAVTGFTGIAIDISERKKAEEKLVKALEKEMELNELKSRFVSMASHEFRTPLSTVLSSAYLIEKYNTTDDQPKREKHLQRIISSVNMLTDILNDFLSLGKIEEGKIQVRGTEFNIDEYVSSTLEEIKNMLKKRQKISYHHQGGRQVLMDASLLKHIIMNLVSNASKFSAEGSTIEINSINDEKYIEFFVKDTGMGISREDQQHLMERFFRGANATNVQGTGLGLHIVSKYADLMNGKLSCESELEKGTTFTILFTK